MSLRVDFSPEALGYVNRIEGFCDNLAIFPDRGIRRDDLRPGLRLVGFERRVAIAFCITDDAITILRILYGGRRPETVFEE